LILDERPVGPWGLLHAPEFFRNLALKILQRARFCLLDRRRIIQERGRADGTGAALRFRFEQEGAALDIP